MFTLLEILFYIEDNEHNRTYIYSGLFEDEYEADLFMKENREVGNIIEIIMIHKHTYTLAKKFFDELISNIIEDMIEEYKPKIIELKR